MSFCRPMLRIAILLVLVLAPSSLHAGVIAKCGKGYLEERDGYLVLHLKGTPYEMGFQHGRLLKKQCHSLIHELFEVQGKKAEIEILGMKLKAEQAINIIFNLQKQFIPERYIEEMQGLADGAEVDEKRVFVANSIPELFHCSGFALLNEVTEAGTLLHGRVLDYGIDWRLQEHAVLVIAEPEGYAPFVNVTYSGFIGSVTGMNANQISIGEMGGRGLGKWAGTPMAFLVRRVLEEARTLDEAIAIFRDARRTCEYYYVLADAKSNRAVGMDGSADRFAIIEPGKAHERLPTPVENTVLMSAGSRYDNLCRIVNEVLHSKEKFSVERAIRLMDAPVAMKSNLHNVLMAPGLGKLWVANASADQKPAWSQKYYEFDIRALMRQEVPTGGEELDPPPSTRPVQAAERAQSDAR
jgi:isopenicillin-N N-acyltransferase-like protein